MLRTLVQKARPTAGLRAFSPSVSAVLPANKLGMSTKILTVDTINQNLVKAKYAVRGDIVIRADNLRKELAGKDHGKPFEEIIACNIGNPQELGQVPITFFRQVLALLQYPDLMKNEETRKAFPADAIERAETYLKRVRGGTGAYSSSQGVEVVREEVAKYIEDRDGYPANVEDIFLTDGASSSVRYIMQTTITKPEDGLLCPIPQYPLYSASMTLFNGTLVPYLLNETNQWTLNVDELRKSLAEYKNKGITTRGLVVINPGNPTGQCLDIEAMKEVVRFCAENRIVLLADEVYQTNIYGKTPFTSFKKVVMEMGEEYKDFELISFHSVSKGFLGECGQRGGYMEMHNIDPQVKAQIYKLASISLCSNLTGQYMVGLMTNPPKEGMESFEKYNAEKTGILGSLQRRAKLVAHTFNSIDGIECAEVEGALYAFPTIQMPKGALEEAEAQGQSPCHLYSLAMLEATGICVVPGAGFGQKDGTFHFRTTILPSEDVLSGVMERFKKFHTEYMAKY